MSHSLRTVARQALLSLGFTRPEYWSGLLFSSPKDLPDPGIKPESPTWQAYSLALSHQGSHNGHNNSKCKWEIEFKSLEHTVPGTKVLLKCWLDSVSHRYKTSCWVLCSLKLFLEVIFLANFFSGEKQNKAGFPSWLSSRVPPTKQKHRFDAWSGSGKIPHVMKQLNPWVPTTEPEL